jgi:hypothetical protein
MRVRSQKSVSVDVKPAPATTIDQSGPILYGHRAALEPPMHSHDVKRSIGGTCVRVDRLSIRPQCEK